MSDNKNLDDEVCSPSGTAVSIFHADIGASYRKYQAAIAEPDRAFIAALYEVRGVSIEDRRAQVAEADRLWQAAIDEPKRVHRAEMAAASRTYLSANGAHITAAFGAYLATTIADDPSPLSDRTARHAGTLDTRIG